MGWTFQAHQIEGADWALKTMREHGLAYLAWKERTRKTGTALLTVENSLATSCLILTKKKAMPGWLEHLDKHVLTKQFTVINYESAHKILGKFDFIILDEAHHAISAFPKPSKTWKTVASLCAFKPILYLSATPYAEHLGLLFNQLKLSNWTPFKYRNGYDFFRAYGKPHKTMTPYGLKETYSKFQDDKILAEVAHLFNFKTRQDVGIYHEPTVKVIKVAPSKNTSDLMKSWKANRVLQLHDHEILGDTDSKMRTVHYQLEGGMLKIDDATSIEITPDEAPEKVRYIIDNYDTSNIAVMAHFIAEREMLKKYLPWMPVYSSDGDAEGVDLSHINKLLIYSMSFKTSKHTQRIARQANHDRKEPIEVDILVMDKPGVGYEVYKTVAIKEQNFTKNSYDRI